MHRALCCIHRQYAQYNINMYILQAHSRSPCQKLYKYILLLRTRQWTCCFLIFNGTINVFLKSGSRDQRQLCPLCSAWRPWEVFHCAGARCFVLEPPSGKSSEDRNPCVHVGSHYRLQTLQPQPAPLLLVTARPCYKSIRKFFIDAILYNYLKQLNIYLHLNHKFENMTPSSKSICSQNIWNLLQKHIFAQLLCARSWRGSSIVASAAGDQCADRRGHETVYKVYVQCITITMSVQYVLCM